MIKKFFVAVILAVFILSAQIAAAAAESVPNFETKSELARYIENGRRRGQTEFNFVLTYVKVNNQEELNRLASEFASGIAPAHKANLSTPLLGTGRFTYKITKEYPGTRVANAYLSKDKYQSWIRITNEEQKLYNIAVGIVAEANKRSSEIEKARYIHDEICRRVKEYRVENERNKTAIGALIDGYAQCQGFSDAFYMLGRMSGLNVGRIFGTMRNEPHGWNWITFSDGKSYLIDVTNGFNTKEEYLFCATKERMEKVGWWCDWSIISNLQ